MTWMFLVVPAAEVLYLPGICFPDFENCDNSPLIVQIKRSQSNQDFSLYYRKWSFPVSYKVS